MKSKSLGPLSGPELAPRKTCAASRESARAEIARQTEEFLRGGGSINRFPAGHTGVASLQANDPCVEVGRRKRAVESAHRTRATRATLSLAAAAKLAGVCPVTLRTAINQGKGPPYNARGKRYEFARVDILRWKQEREAKA